MRERQVWTLGHEDPSKKGRAAHSSILAWEITGTEEPGGLQSVHGVARVRHDWATNQQLCLPSPHENEKAGDQSSAPTPVVQGEDKE